MQKILKTVNVHDMTATTSDQAKATAGKNPEENKRSAWVRIKSLDDLTKAVQVYVGEHAVGKNAAKWCYNPAGNPAAKGEDEKSARTKQAMLVVYRPGAKNFAWSPTNAPWTPENAAKKAQTVSLQHMQTGVLQTASFGPNQAQSCRVQAITSDEVDEMHRKFNKMNAEDNHQDGFKLYKLPEIGDKKARPFPSEYSRCLCRQASGWKSLRLLLGSGHSCEGLESIYDLQKVVAGVTEKYQGRPGIHQCDSPQSSPGVPALSAAATYKHTLSPMGRVSTVILVLLPSRKTPAEPKKALGPPKCLNDKFDTPLAEGTEEDADDQLARQQRLVARTACFTFGAIQQRHFFSSREKMDITRLDPVAPRTSLVFYDPNTIFPDLDVDTSEMSSQELAKLEAARVYPQDHNDFFSCLRLFCDATISQLAQSMLDEQNVKDTDPDKKDLYELNRKGEQSWNLKKRFWTGKKKGQAVWDWRLNQEAFYYNPENGALQGQEHNDLLKLSTYARKSGKSSRQDQWSEMTGMDPPNRGWWRRVSPLRRFKKNARAVGPFDINTNENDPKEDHLVSFSHIRGILLGNLVLRMAFVSATTPLTLPKNTKGGTKKGQVAEEDKKDSERGEKEGEKAEEEEEETDREAVEKHIADTQDRDDEDIGEPLGSSVSHRIAAYKKHQAMKMMMTVNAVASSTEDAAAVAAAEGGEGGKDSVWERYNSRKHLIQTEDWLYTQMTKHGGAADSPEARKLMEVMTSGEDMFLDEWYSDLQLPRLAYEVDQKKMRIPEMSLPPRVEWVVIGLPLASPSLIMAATAPVDIGKDTMTDEGGEKKIKDERKKKRMLLLYTAVSNVLVQEVGAQGIIRYFEDEGKYGEAKAEPWFGMDPFYDVYGDFKNDKGFRAHDQKARWKIAKWVTDSTYNKEEKMAFLGRTPGFREMGIPFLSTNCLLGVTPESDKVKERDENRAGDSDWSTIKDLESYPKGAPAPPIAKISAWHFTQECARLMLGHGHGIKNTPPVDR
ncbi:unnamed protein product [Amoebophrya sp. A25]|nr:unnamed protein product [Amoebophrya sp. A25]|eukprot:GSA25T00017957001.1